MYRPSFLNLQVYCNNKIWELEIGVVKVISPCV